MKRIIVSILALLLFAAPGFAATKIAYVDLRVVLQTSTAGIAAKNELAVMEKDLETEFKIKNGELLKFQEDAKKQADLLSESAKQQKVQELQRMVMELRSFEQNAKMKIQREDRVRSKTMVDELRAILQEIGKKGKYTMIMEVTEGGLFYVDDSVDNLTDKLLKKYNASK